jgi:two-component system, sensor histidine kinase and response regulator
MADSAHLIANGDLSQRVEAPHSGDELERLAVAFNQMAQRVSERVEELRAFAHTVAHDLKQPLNVLIGYTDLLQESSTTSKVSNDQIAYCTDQITRISWKMNAIIRELLLLAEIRDVEIIAQPLDMQKIITEAQKRLGPTIEEAKAEIRLPEQWPTSYGHAPWVEEIWANYISNALKYGGKPPSLEFGSTVEADGQVRYWLHDNGSGLTDDQKLKLFTPFSRLKQNEVAGHGLGLSIVRRIAEKLGGRVGVESAPGKGSTFYFTLPAKPHIQQEPAAPVLANAA